MEEQEAQQLKVNDILVYRYGYDMTIYTFFVVIKVTKASVVLAELIKDYVHDTNSFTPTVEPGSELLDKPSIQKRKNNLAKYSLYDKTKVYRENHLD